MYTHTHSARYPGLAFVRFFFLQSPVAEMIEVSLLMERHEAGSNHTSENRSHHSALARGVEISHHRVTR